MPMPEHTPGPTEVKGGLAVTENAQAPEHGAADHATVPEQGSLVELAGVARRYDMGEVTVTALEGVNLRTRTGRPFP
jgi:hypothetical protein